MAREYPHTIVTGVDLVRLLSILHRTFVLLRHPTASITLRLGDPLRILYSLLTDEPQCPCPINDSPPNCRFELDDVNNPMTHFYNRFDLVHIRCIVAGVSLYTSVLSPQHPPEYNASHYLLFAYCGCRVLTRLPGRSPSSAS